MRSSIVIVLASLSIISLTGCSQAVPSKQLNLLQTKVRRLNKKVTKLATLLTSVSANVTLLDFELAVNDHSSALFHSTDAKFQPLDAKSGVGVFAVSIKDVRPYANGVRLVINLGNLTEATFSGATLQLAYGPSVPAIGTHQADSNVRMKTAEILQTLYPGRWNPVPVILPDISANQFKYLRISISTNILELY